VLPDGFASILGGAGSCCGGVADCYGANQINPGSPFDLGSVAKQLVALLNKNVVSTQARMLGHFIKSVVKKFVVVAGQRTGSSLLASLLGHHPNTCVPIHFGVCSNSYDDPGFTLGECFEYIQPRIPQGQFETCVNI